MALTCHSLGRTIAAELLVHECPLSIKTPAGIQTRADVGIDSLIMDIAALEAHPEVNMSLLSLKAFQCRDIAVPISICTRWA